MVVVVSRACLSVCLAEAAIGAPSETQIAAQVSRRSGDTDQPSAGHSGAVKSVPGITLMVPLRAPKRG